LLKNKARVSQAVGILIAVAVFIVAPVYFSLNPSTPGWVGFDNSKDKSQVTTEKVDGKIKTTETTKFEQAKTLWDWLSLLGAPATLAVFGFWFQFSQERAKISREKAEKEREEAVKLRAEEQAKVEKERANEQAKAEKERSEDRQRDDDLEAYINSISDLLVGKNLSTLAKQKMIGTLQHGLPGFLDVSLNVIRARTLSIFRRFTDDKDPNRTNGERKSSILLFLSETGLLRNLKEYEQGQEDAELKQFQALLSLSDADLSDVKLFRANLICANLSRADLTRADLTRANLSHAKLIRSNLTRALLTRALLTRAHLTLANLTYADLSDASLIGANLKCANLKCADFTRANLTRAELIYADLSDANLSDADLSDADFNGAELKRAILDSVNLNGTNLDRADLSDAILLAVDLSQTKSLTLQQLEGEHQPLLCKVNLPKDIDVDPNRDCKEIPELLVKRYPEQFKTLEEAQAYVDKQTIPL